jgi:hypothetical protein
MAAKLRAASKVVVKAEEALRQVQARLHTTTGEPAKRGPGRPAKAVTNLEKVAQDVEAARHEHHRLAGQREPVTQSIRAIGHAYHFVALARGVRRHGKLIAGDIQAQIDTIRTLAQQAGLSQVCVDRIEKAERVMPTMQATLEFVSGYVRQKVQQRELGSPQSFARHAHLLPSYDLERGAAPRTVTQGEALRALAERLRTPLFEPEGTLGAWSLMKQNQLKAEAAKLAEVFQRSRSNVEGRNGYLSLRNHQLRGLEPPRKRTCLTAIHNFFLTRPDGTTAAERFFGQKPRSMCAAILAAVEIPPAPLRPPRRAVG